MNGDKKVGELSLGVRRLVCLTEAFPSSLTPKPEGDVEATNKDKQGLH